MNLVDILELGQIAYDAGHIEDPRQLAADALTLEPLGHGILANGISSLKTLTEAQVEGAAEALARTAAVFAAMMKVPADRAHVMTYLKSL